jgi:cytochrome c peroxidase
MNRSLVLVCGLLAACEVEPEPDGDSYVLPVPVGFPQPRIPEDNPMSAAKVELGRHLFYDVRLSGNGTQACGSCHFQELAFTDGLVVAEGSTGEIHPRNANGLTNVAYNATLTWANPVLTELETQLLVPIFGEHPVELGATNHQDEILDRLAADARYPGWFEQAFPDHEIKLDWDRIVDALSAFSRTLISGDSPYDRYVYQDDTSALSPEALRGLELFYSERLECHHCHGGFNFTESSVHADSGFDAARFHNTGLYNLDGQGSYPLNNTGLYDITSEPDDMGRFRPPSLRNVEVTAPYMHDGSIATLEEVIRTYEAGGRLIEDGPYAGDGRVSPLKSGLVPGFALTDEERADLIAFLKSLTDETFLTDPRFSDPFVDER